MNNNREPLHIRLNQVVENYTRENQLLDSAGANLEGIPLSDRINTWGWETDPDGNLVWCSPEITQYTDYTPDELIGTTAFQAVLSPVDSARLNQELQSMEGFQNLTLDVHTRDGKYFKVSFNAETITAENGSPALQGIARMILTDHQDIPHETEQDLTRKGFSPENESRFAGSSLLSGFSLDSNGFQAFTSQLEAPASNQENQWTLKIPVRSGNSILGFLELERESGDPAWSEEEIVLVENLSSQLASAFQDARAYELTLQALEEMQRADQLKSQLLANMSHELRTPLNSIIGFSSVILKGIDGPINETQEQDVQQIHNAGQHLLGLINNVLDLSKIEADKMQLTLSRVNLAEIIHEVVEIANALIKQKPVELLMDIPGNPVIEADSTRVRQILLNLISNAVNFTDQGQIGVFVRTLSGVDGEEILIAVADTGIGIPPEDQTRLFKPFSQIQDITSQPRSGTGLGLSICRHLVELHHGRIWVESSPDTGSIFAFILPTRQSDSPEEMMNPTVTVFSRNRNTVGYLQELLPETPIHQATLAELDSSQASLPLSDSLYLAEIPFEQDELWSTLHDLSHSDIFPAPMQLFALEEDRGMALPPVRLGPLTLSARQAQTLTTRIERSSAESSIRVFLIDSDPNNLDLLEQTLKKDGFAFHLFTTAGEALEEIHHHPPAAILFNLFMPHADGFRIFETVRAEQLYSESEIVLLIPDSPAGHEGRQFLRYMEHLYANNAVPLQSVQKLIQQAVVKYSRL